VVLDALSFGSDVRNLPEGTKIVGGLGRQRVGGLPPVDCVLVVGDVSDAGLVSELVAGTDVCFHLAAQTHVDRSYGDVRPFVDSNVVGSYAVLEAFRAHPGKRLVFMSTDEVYGDKQDGLSLETDPLSPRNIYCLSPDSLIPVSTGKWERIDATDSEVIAFDFQERKTRFVKPCRKVKFPHSSTMINVRTEAGALLCTEGHKFFSKIPKRWRSGKIASERDWPFASTPVTEVSASELRPGDFVAALRKIPVKEPRQVFDPEMWRLLGYFCGDGYLSHLVPKGRKATRWYVTFSDEKRWLLEKYAAIAEECLYDEETSFAHGKALSLSGQGKGAHAIAREIGQPRGRVGHWISSLEPRKPRLTVSPCFVKHPTRNCWCMQFGCLRLVRLIKELGLDVYAAEKKVPERLFNATDQEVAEFLAGLYDADGTAGGRAVSFSSDSVALLEGVRRLLRRLGIVARLVTPSERPGHTVNWRLNITDGYSLRTFAHCVPVFKTTQIAMPKPQRMNSDKDILWARVEEVTREQNRHGEVYDFEVSDVHNYVANGLIVHNSTLKAGGDLLARTYAAVYGLDVVIARPANNYGPRQFEEKLVPKIATTLLRRASGGGADKIPIYGDGSHVRDWLFVRDTAEALVALWERGKRGEAYNLGAHQFRTVIEVVRAVSALLGVPWEEHVVHVADRICGDSRYALDLSKATKELGWRAGTAFKEGMEETVRWHRMAHDAPGARR
jgi:dTDP-D-glucose 4,6-dehydratase/intein/homing endonuclease